MAPITYRMAGSGTPRMNLRRSVILLLLLLSAAAGLWVSVRGQPGALGHRGQVKITDQPDLQQTVYEIAAGRCRVQWIVEHSEINRGIILHRCSCDLPLSEQGAAISKLLETVSAQEPEASFRTLFVGRLSSFPGLSERLASTAAHSQAWDAENGRGRSAQTSRAVAALGKEAGLFKDWQTVFRRFGRHVVFSSVEEVQVSRAGDLPFFKQLQQQGVSGADRLPYDCAVWLDIGKDAPEAPK